MKDSELAKWAETTETIPGRSATIITVDDGEAERGIIRVSNGRPTSGAIQNWHGGNKYRNSISWKYRKGETIEGAKAYLMKQMQRYVWCE